MPEREADRGQRRARPAPASTRVPARVLAHRAADALAQRGDERVVGRRSDYRPAVATLAGHQSVTHQGSREAVTAGRALGGGTGRRARRAGHREHGVRAAWSARSTSARTARSGPRRSACWSARSTSSVPMRCGAASGAEAAGAAVIGLLGRHVGRRRERLHRHAHEVSLHHRGPGRRRVAGAEVAGRTVVRRQPVVERVVAVAADVHHRRRQLRGVADEPGRRDVAVVVGRGAGLAGGRAIDRLGVGPGAVQDHLLQGVADVAVDVGPDRLGGVRLVLVEHLAGAVGDLVDDVDVGALAAVGDRGVGVGHVDRR